MILARAALRRRRAGPDVPVRRRRRWPALVAVMVTSSANRMHADRRPGSAAGPARTRSAPATRRCTASSRWPRRLVGPRPRRQPGEVGLAARGAQRLHLRDHRRGARAGRDARRARAVRRCSAGPACGWSPAATTCSSGSPRPASMAWMLGQALVNIGAVLGLLPIIGLPLPLVSCGGSALVTDDAGARHADVLRPAEPGAREALAAARRAAAALARGPAGRAGAVGLVTTSVSCSPAVGPAGHVAPLLAVADACAVATRRRAITALGTAEGLETRLVPGARLRRCATIPPVPVPRRPGADLAAAARAAARPVRAAGRRACASSGADVVVGFGGYVAAPAYLAARRRGVPIVVHEANARPGWPTGSVPGSRRTSATTFAGTPLPHAVRTGHAAAPQISSLPTLDRRARRAPRRGPRGLGLDPDRPTLLVTGGSLGRAAAQRDVRRRARRTCAAAGVQVLHVSRLGKHVHVDVRGGDADGRRAVRRAAVPATGMDLAYAGGRPGALPGRREHRVRAGRGRAARRRTCRCRSATASSGSTPSRWWRPAAGCSSTTPAARRSGSRAGAAAAAGATRPAGGDGRRRRRGSASRDADERLADLVLDAAAERQSRAVSAAGGGRDRRRRPPRDLAPVHFVGIGGAGMSGIARIMLARGSAGGGSDAKDSRGWPRCAAGARRARRATTPASVDGARTVVVSAAVRDDNPELAEARERGLRVLHRSAGAGRGDGRAPGRRGRRHARQDHDDVDAHRGAAALRRSTRRSRSAATSPSPAPTRTTAPARSSSPRPTRATARSCSTARTSPSSPTSSPTTSTTTARPRRSSRASSSFAAQHPAGRARWWPAPTTPARPGWRSAAARARASPSAPTARPTAPTCGSTTWGSTAPGRGFDVWAAGRPVGRARRRRARPAQRAQRARGAGRAIVGLGVAARRLRGRRSAAFTGTRRRFEPRGSAGGVRVFDDYAHHPTEVAAALRRAPGRRRAAGSSWSSSRTCTAAPRTSRPSSARRSGWPTRSS